MIKHLSCPGPDQSCPGYDLDIDLDNITEATFQAMNDASAEHMQTHRPAVTHIRKQINPHRRRGNGFYTLKLSAAENGSQTLCGDHSTTEDMGYGDTRSAKGLSFVTCEACKQIREEGN